MYGRNITRIESHVRDPETDQPYQPLRQTLVKHSGSDSPKVNRQEIYEELAKFSKLSPERPKNIQPVNHQYIRENTYIRDDVKLKKSHDLSSLPHDRTYQIINYEQKIKQPINELEFSKRYSNKEEVIVYKYDENNQQNKMNSLEEQVEPYTFKRSRKNKKGININATKYNFFSFLDEPVNNILNGLGCICPRAQLVASKRSEVEWFIDEKD